MVQVFNRDIVGYEVIIALSDKPSLKIGGVRQWTTKHMSEFSFEGFYPIGEGCIHIQETEQGALICNIGSCDKIGEFDDDYPYILATPSEVKLLKSQLKHNSMNMVEVCGEFVPYETGRRMYLDLEEVFGDKHIKTA